MVARVGDEELTNSELQIYYWQSVDEFYSYYGYYMDMESMDLDLEKPLDQQYYNEEEGITWQQYFVDGALSSWSRYAALSMLGKEAGFELDADAKAYVESIPADLETLAVSYGYENAAAMLKEDMGAACDVEGYKRFLSAGCSVPPIEALKYAGVDMSDVRTVERSLKVFADTVDMLKENLNK